MQISSGDKAGDRSRHFVETSDASDGEIDRELKIGPAQI
jgi:hypothetical protein